MRVVILGRYPLDESITDGAVRYAVNLCQALEQINGLELHVVTLGDQKQTKVVGRITVHVVARRSFPLQTGLPELFPLIRQVQQLDPALVHVIGSTQPYGLPAVYLAKRYRCKVLLSVLGISQVEARIKYQKPVHAFYRFWFPWVERKSLQVAPVVALTPSVADYLRAMTARPIAVIPPGIDSRFFDIERTHPRQWLILSVAVVEPRKGLLDLVQAVELLGGRYPILLYHVGRVVSTRYYEVIQQYITSRQLVEQVHLLGEIGQHQLEQLLAQATVFALPSYEESFGQSAAEAMAVGLPVVVTRVRGLQDLVEDGQSGLLVEPHSPEELAQKLEAILMTPHLATHLSEGGRQRARRYQWPEVASQFFRLYQEYSAGGVGS